MKEVDKKAIPTKFLWVDLEMTGLDATQDVILEIAAEITDAHFNTLGSYEAIVHQPHSVLVDRFGKNQWYQKYPENRDDFLKKCAEGTPSEQVERELIEFVQQHFGSEAAVLAGNSIHNDRNFIKQWWPTFDLKLHYRMLDVSAWKVFMQARYGVIFEKKEVHRAYDDIQASIAELQHYLEWFDRNDL